MRLSLTLLTRSDAFYTSRRLMETARTQGCLVSWVDASAPSDAFLTHLADSAPEGRLPDLVLPRIGSRSTASDLGMLSVLIDAGIFSPSSPAALRTAMDKAETYARLVASEVAAVPTVPLDSVAEANAAAQHLGDGPWVLKPRFGSQGRDVLLANTPEALEATAATVLSRNDAAIIQPFVPMKSPRDQRVLVVGGVARASCWRVAADGEFRSNVHLGARTEAAVLCRDTARLAESAARAVGLSFAGVDLLPTEEHAGGLVLEVNGSPGLEGIERATGRDLASEVVAWAIDAYERREDVERIPTSSRA